MAAIPSLQASCLLPRQEERELATGQTNVPAELYIHQESKTGLGPPAYGHLTGQNQNHTVTAMSKARCSMLEKKAFGMAHSLQVDCSQSPSQRDAQPSTGHPPPTAVLQAIMGQKWSSQMAEGPL